MDKKLLYWSFVRSESKRINSDGCTLVSELFHDACLQHDLAYRYGKDPRSAYAFYLADTPEYWGLARAITRGEADTQFRKNMQERSRLGRWSPIAAVRWAGVRVGAWMPWKRYRNGH